MNRPASILFCFGMIAALCACQQRVPAAGEEPSDPAEKPAPAPATAPEAETSEPVSILRPEVALPEAEADTLTPLLAVIGFPGGGAELDADAVAELEKIAASPQAALGGPIILSAHTDADGSDKVNADAAEARGLAVASWLIEQGVEADRIDVIVFGEQNPLEPNALPDGAPNEAGRAANRRVEVEVGTLKLTVSTDEDLGEDLGED